MENTLQTFGESFIKSVRDNTLFVLEGIIGGQMKSPVDREMHDRIRSMSAEDIDVLKDFAFRMVDLSLHNMLFMLESNPNWVLSSKDERQNLSQMSDGLSGELYTSDGWISNFSKYPPSKGL